MAGSSGGVWGLSYLCIRQYGKGALGSLLRHSRRAYRPLLAAVLLVCGVLLHVGQPFVDRSAAEIDYEFLFCSEPLEAVTCSSRYADVRPDPKTGRVYGQAAFQLQNSSGQEQNARFQINPGYEITAVQANGADVPFSVDSYQAMGEKMFTVTLPAETEIELVIDYGGFPQEWNLVSAAQGGSEISDTYMELENHQLSPPLMMCCIQERRYPP